MRRINGTALVAEAPVGTLGALAFQVWSYAERAGTGQANLAAGTVHTPWGPLTATDRDLIVRVRLAGLWELAAARQALERAPGPAMREAAGHLIPGHTDLARRVRVVARDLGVELPNRPTVQQQGWLSQLTTASGEDCVKTWANLLRSAHGRIFPVIGAVRNQTRNSLVRQLASDANRTVLDHITVLEKSGALDVDAIADDPVAGTAADPYGSPPSAPGWHPGGAPFVEATGGIRATSRPSPDQPGTVATNRPDPEDPDARPRRSDS